ncbi:hypothetical protein BC937DRAFT_89664 [Endogone sp. FLAS-F59071]|nr:hypothetical protein BC937DRAFT_89664 [Endogone sp. FLAS-F59071]|eukprot:RUS17668.1 hypothetical protein BC937DRAFT_89664 [Endogone sp. FLAS-F59071]
MPTRLSVGYLTVVVSLYPPAETLCKEEGDGVIFLRFPALHSHFDHILLSKSHTAKLLPVFFSVVGFTKDDLKTPPHVSQHWIMPAQNFINNGLYSQRCTGARGIADKFENKPRSCDRDFKGVDWDHIQLKSDNCQCGYDIENYSQAFEYFAPADNQC